MIRIAIRAAQDGEGRDVTGCQPDSSFSWISWERQQSDWFTQLKGKQWWWMGKGLQGRECTWVMHLYVDILSFPVAISPFVCFHGFCCSHCSHPCWCHHHHQQGLMTMNNSYRYPARESESCSVVSDSLRPRGLYSPWNSPGQNTGVGSLSLLQGIFPTQGSNPGLLHCRRILYQLSHWWNILRYPSKGTVITDILAVFLLCCSKRKCTA